MLVGLSVMRANGYRWNTPLATNQEVEDIAVAVATGRMNIQDVKAWLERIFVR